MRFKAWFEAVSRDNQVWAYHEEGNITLYMGVPNDTNNSTPLGYIHYRFPKEDTVDLQYIHVHYGNRRKGIAKRLYEEFTKVMAEQYPQIKHVVARATSQRAMNIHNKALGNPRNIYRGIQRWPIEKAMDYLPRHSPENIPGHGVASLAKDRYVTLRHKLSS